MSETETGIIDETSLQMRKNDSAALCASIVKGRFVSTGISFSRLGGGRIGVSAHDDNKTVAFAISISEAAELGARLIALAQTGGAS
jgi:hypothetical protein